MMMKSSTASTASTSESKKPSKGLRALFYAASSTGWAWAIAYAIQQAHRT